MSKPLLGFFSHHKCGTLWITKVLDSVCQKLGLERKHAHEAGMFGHDIAASRQREGFDFLTYTNADYRHVRGLDVRGFHVVRDPRDMIVSGYFSHLQRHWDQSWTELRAYRPLLQGVSKEAGLMMEMQFSGRFMEDLRSWPESPPQITLVRFEDLVADPGTHYRRILEHLGLMGESLSGEELDAIVEQHSFKVLAGRKAGEEDVSSHYRKGVAGDWANHFAPCHVWMFKARYNDLLIQYGYELDDRWEGATDVEASLSQSQLEQFVRGRRWDRARRLKDGFVARLPARLRDNVNLRISRIGTALRRLSGQGSDASNPPE